MKKLVAAAVIAAVAAIAASGSAAASKPVVVLGVPSSSEADTAIPFTYVATNVQAREHVVLQRQQGTARVWRTVAKLKATSKGSGIISGLALGTYHLRLAAIRKGVLLAHAQKAVNVFGPVPLKMLLSGYKGFFAGPYGREGSYPTASSTFEYVLGLPEYQSFSSQYELPDPVSASRNHCRSIHVDFLPANVDGASVHHSSTDEGTFTIVQAALDPVSATARYETVGHLDATLEPGRSWAIRLSTSYAGDSILDDVAFYINGTGSCDSASSLY